jgi:uncharacterized surface protein with fasciclin (FAS1) repeats
MGTRTNSQSGNLLDIAAEQGSFVSFGKAVEQAGLGDVLRGDGPFTVFAPTDAAFANLPEGKLASLMQPESRGELAAILKYHVINGRKSTTDMAKWDSARTYLGQNAKIKVNDGAFRIDGALVTDGDIDSSNGVIHGIDRVIIPYASTMM